MTASSNVQTTVPFVDLKAQYKSIRDEVRDEVDNVFESTQFILGDAVEKFERDFANFLGVKHVLGVGSGLDALRLALEAAGVSAGDEVIIPANTFIATALAVSGTGAKPVLVDCREDTYQIDPELIEPAITPSTRVIMPVHLYGQAADITAITEIARNHHLEVIEDAAQAHGTRFQGQRCGSFGLAGCFSFYPGKNLGAYGDGGAIATNDDDFAKRVNSLRNYGQKQKYVHVEKGTNSRLDTVQAAILNVKLRRLDDWNAARRAHAAIYSDSLAKDFIVPALDPRSEHIFHLYVVRTPNREELQQHLNSLGIQTGIHYPIPIHLQEAYRDLGHSKGSFPVTEKLADEIVSLPMFPELTQHQIELVLEALSSFKTERVD
ncbi:MAG TPA: DegT/DnrJ/EryC1/StrS family aminotransferase [Pyrinomonadaceae bacterium]|nr:DegT/DnrJ/EryC1/StrS family aminotransferase [Pyrinomonadaceae bacterium]